MTFQGRPTAAPGLPAGVRLIPSDIDPTAYVVHKDDQRIGVVNRSLPGGSSDPWRYSHRRGGYGGTSTRREAVLAILELESNP